MPDVEPMWAWQVLDDDGRWGTISVYMEMAPMRVVGNTEQGHNWVLTARSERIIRGPMREIAELHARMTRKPVRLHRFIPDPAFTPEELVLDGRTHDRPQ